MTKPRPSKWDPIDQLRVHTGHAEDVVPEGAFSVAEYAARYRVTIRRAEIWLGERVSQGHLCRGKKRIGHHNHLVWFYWKNPSKALDA